MSKHPAPAQIRFFGEARHVYWLHIFHIIKLILATCAKVDMEIKLLSKELCRTRLLLQMQGDRQNTKFFKGALSRLF